MTCLKNGFLKAVLLSAVVASSACSSSNNAAPLTPVAPANVWPSSQIAGQQDNSGSLVVTNSNGQVIFTQTMPIDHYKTTRELLVVQYRDPAQHILVINADGRQLLDADGTFEGHDGSAPEVQVSDELVSIQYENQGTHVLAMNAAGDTLIAYQTIYNNANVKLSNRIVALSYEDHGVHILAFSAQGAELLSPTDVYADNVYDTSDLSLEDDAISLKTKDGKDISIHIDKNGQVEHSR
jgi:hypothetical protein